MRIVRIIVSVAFVGVIIAAAVFRFTNVKDTTAPVITCSENILNVPCGITDAELLDYVKAYDAKDGDLTKIVIVEDISAFVEIGMSNITYTVCDSDNNVAKLVKRAVFSDYRAPRIYLRDSFIFSTEEENNDLLSHIGATDMFDGDISRKVTIVASSFDGSVSGKYDVTCKVANSMGDYSIVTFSAIVNSEKYTASIIPSAYTYYIKAGDSFGAADCVGKIIDIDTGTDSAVFSKSDVRIDASQLNTAVPGTYNVFFTLTDPEHHRIAARTRVTVICEEK